MRAGVFATVGLTWLERCEYLLAPLGSQRPPFLSHGDSMQLSAQGAARVGALMLGLVAWAPYVAAQVRGIPEYHSG
jgi:hypothetical protein